MKKTFRMMMAAVVGLAMLGFTACTKPDPNPEPDTNENITYTESSTYAIHYDGRTVAAGETVVYHHAAGEEDFASVDFLLENKNVREQSTCIKIELVEGNSEMKEIMLCYGTTCKSGTCPWTSEPFSLVPGINEDMLIKFEYVPSDITTTTAKYRITVGASESLNDPQVIMLKVD